MFSCCFILDKKLKNIIGVNNKIKHKYVYFIKKKKIQPITLSYFILLI